jgi:hypothetical protein
MTILLLGRVFLAEALAGKNRIVIPTGAKRSGGTCGFFFLEDFEQLLRD